MKSIEACEQERHEAVQRLAARRSLDERNRLGQYGTPFELAAPIVKQAMGFFQHDSIRYLEPGFGTGPFFSALLQRKSPPMATACGFEIDDDYARFAESLWSHTELDIKREDFATALPNGERFNLLICNPPYVRHHHLDALRKEELRDHARNRSGFDISGLSSLYAYFLANSIAWMAPGGIAAWLLPSEFFDVNYGRDLLQTLSRRVSILRIHKFESERLQFSDALVASTVLFIRNEQPETNHLARLTHGPSLESPQRSETIGFDSGQRSTDEDGPQLSDCFSIRRGIATGGNAFFILGRQEARQLKLPAEFLRPILPSPRKLTTDIVESDVDGFPQVDPQLVLVDCPHDSQTVRAAYPSMGRYLDEGRRQGIHQRYLCRNRRPWYKQEQRAVPPFLCTYMGRRTKSSRRALRFIWNRSSAIAANVYLLLTPLPWLQKHLDENPKDYELVWDSLTAIEESQFVSAGRAYGGGLRKIEPRELGRLTVAGSLAEMAVDCRPEQACAVPAALNNPQILGH